MSTYRLSGRVVAITGAAGGLGSTLAKQLIAKGAHICSIANNNLGYF
jgi:NAD(P)-dependent dehydrogenase (short-subunit alcohol dehydrogenase family)